MQSANGVEDNIQKIAQLFPDCVTETVDEKSGQPKHLIDFEKLKQNLSDSVMSERAERYQFTWPDKSKAILLANSPINATLRPCREESVDFDHTQNLYIEGDNLDVLKCLKETYLHKVKMIYIDPPYNTGNDFVYEDDFAQSSEEYLANSGQYDEQGNRMFTNAESNGRFHTDWLNMIYPRLKVARDLLTDDGVIFISIDDNEVENLRKVCDEVFGENNFIGCIAIKSNPRGSMSSAELANLHEYLLLYTKRRVNANIIGHELSNEMKKEYKFKDEFGSYRLLGLRMRGGFWRRSDRPNLYFPLYVNPITKQVALTKDSNYFIEVLPIQPTTNEDGTWRWSKEKISLNLNLLQGKTVIREEKEVWDICQKDYYNKYEVRRTKAKSIWEEGEINYQNGTICVKNLLGKSGIFDYSKPIFLIQKACNMIDIKDDDIILDFFSGSATTAHAVMQLNTEDGGNRKFIMVQLPELTYTAKTEKYKDGDEEKERYIIDETTGHPAVAKDSDARKAGYYTICEIGKERIRRAGKKIKEESPLTTQDLDTGFRVLKLDSTNMEDIYYSPKDLSQADLFTQVDNVKSDRTGEDLLFQVMLELGATLDSKIETTTVDGKTIYNVAEGYLVACFDMDVTDEVVTAIAKMQPAYAVLRDTSMKNDATATNFEQIFKTYSPDTVTRIL